MIDRVVPSGISRAPFCRKHFLGDRLFCGQFFCPWSSGRQFCAASSSRLLLPSYREKEASLEWRRPWKRRRRRPSKTARRCRTTTPLLTLRQSNRCRRRPRRHDTPRDPGDRKRCCRVLVFESCPNHFLPLCCSVGDKCRR